MLSGYLSCHPSLPSPGSRSAPKKFPKILPNRPDLSPAFRSVFQLRCGRRALRPYRRCTRIVPLTRKHPAISFYFPKFQKGSGKQMTQPPAAQSLAVRPTRDNWPPKTRKGKSAPGYRSVASASGSWSCRLLAPDSSPLPSLPNFHKGSGKGNITITSPARTCDATTGQNRTPKNTKREAPRRPTRSPGLLPPAPRPLVAFPGNAGLSGPA